MKACSVSSFKNGKYEISEMKSEITSKKDVVDLLFPGSLAAEKIDSSEHYYPGAKVKWYWAVDKELSRDHLVYSLFLEREPCNQRDVLRGSGEIISAASVYLVKKDFSEIILTHYWFQQVALKFTPEESKIVKDYFKGIYKKNAKKTNTGLPHDFSIDCGRR